MTRYVHKTHTLKWINFFKINFLTKSEHEIFELAKTQIAINKLFCSGLFKYRGLRYESIKKAKECNLHLYRKIHKHFNSINTDDILVPLGGIIIPFNFLLISRRKLSPYVFFNNIIISNKKSVMMENALELINNNYSQLKSIINCLKENNFQTSELFRSYSLDGILNDSRITLNISGPGLVLNSCLSSLIRFFNLPEDFDRHVLVNFVGGHLSFTEQTLENEESYCSSWMMKKPD